MPVPLLWVQNNDAPNIEITLQRNSIDISLVDASKVELIIVNDRTGEVTNSGHQMATITDAANGLVEYAPVSTDFPEEGRYKCDAKITYTSTKIEILFEQLIVIVRAKNS